jgi:hypothetical protein
MSFFHVYSEEQMQQDEPGRSEEGMEKMYIVDNNKRRENKKKELRRLSEGQTEADEGWDENERRNARCR